MKAIISLCVPCLLLASCTTPKPSSDAESWNGTFATKNKGVQPISIFLSIKESNGIFNIPELVPIPLDIFDLRQWVDSISFKVGFRSGTVTLLGRHVHADTIKGVWIGSDKETYPFVMYRSTVSNNIYNLPKPDASEPFVISLKHNSKTEQASKARLEKIINTHNFNKYIYTKTVMLEDSIIPHSHPTLTINTADTTDENLISTFFHEQMHWFILSKSENTKRVVDILKKEFPEAPVNFPDGSGDIQSTYEHLIVCYYEYQALKEFSGQEKADEVMTYLKRRLYRWIYKTMLENEEKIKGVLEENNLTL